MAPPGGSPPPQNACEAPRTGGTSWCWPNRSIVDRARPGRPAPGPNDPIARTDRPRWTRASRNIPRRSWPSITSGYSRTSSPQSYSALSYRLASIASSAPLERSSRRWASFAILARSAPDSRFQAERSGTGAGAAAPVPPVALPLLPRPPPTQLDPLGILRALCRTPPRPHRRGPPPLPLYPADLFAAAGRSLTLPPPEILHDPQTPVADRRRRGADESAGPAPPCARPWPARRELEQQQRRQHAVGEPQHYVSFLWFSLPSGSEAVLKPVHLFPRLALLS